MWGFLIGLYIAMLIYPFFEEWQQRRLESAWRKCAGITRRAVDGM
jgi:hypothetical protein